MFCWRLGGSERSSEDPEMRSSCLNASDSSLRDTMDLESMISHLLFHYGEQSRAGMLWFKSSHTHENNQHMLSGQSL